MREVARTADLSRELSRVIFAPLVFAEGFSDEIGVAPEFPWSAGTPPVDRKRVACARDWLAVGRSNANLEPGARKCEIVANLNLTYVGADVEVHLFDVAVEVLDEGFGAEGFITRS